MKLGPSWPSPYVCMSFTVKPPQFHVVGRRLTSIQALRKEAGLTQREIAAKLGCSQSTVSMIERGPDPRISTMQRYARACGARVNFELGEKQ